VCSKILNFISIKTNIMCFIVITNESLAPVTISKRVSFVQGHECDAENMANLKPGP